MLDNLSGNFKFFSDSQSAVYSLPYRWESDTCNFWLEAWGRVEGHPPMVYRKYGNIFFCCQEIGTDLVKRCEFLALESELQTFYLYIWNLTYTQLNKFKELAAQATEDRLTTSFYKFTAHNYLVNSCGLPVEKVLKLKIHKKSIFVTYQLPTGKGSTILSLAKCNPRIYDETQYSTLPCIDPYSMDVVPDAEMIVSGWQLLEDGLVAGIITANTAGYAGFVRIDRLPDTAERAFRVDVKWENHEYIPCDCPYDAVFASKNWNDEERAKYGQLGCSYKSDHYPQTLTSAARKLKKATGFGQPSKLV